MPPLVKPEIRKEICSRATSVKSQKTRPPPSDQCCFVAARTNMRRSYPKSKTHPHVAMSTRRTVRFAESTEECIMAEVVNERPRAICAKSTDGGPCLSYHFISFHITLIDEYVPSAPPTDEATPQAVAEIARTTRSSSAKHKSDGGENGYVRRSLNAPHSPCTNLETSTISACHLLHR